MPKLGMNLGQICQEISSIECYMKFKPNVVMTYQENIVGKQPSNEFFGMCTIQESEFMPLALLIQFTLDEIFQ